MANACQIFARVKRTVTCNPSRKAATEWSPGRKSGNHKRWNQSRRDDREILNQSLNGSSIGKCGNVRVYWMYHLNSRILDDVARTTFVVASLQRQ